MLIEILIPAQNLLNSYPDELPGCALPPSMTSLLQKTTAHLVNARQTTAKMKKQRLKLPFSSTFPLTHSPSIDRRGRTEERANKRVGDETLAPQTPPQKSRRQKEGKGESLGRLGLGNEDEERGEKSQGGKLGPVAESGGAAVVREHI